VQTFASNNQTKWNFNLEAAPWMGGFFERLIQSVKRCLKKILVKRRVNYEEMLTILFEVERIINNRPLVYVNSDLTKEPLTPSHLICRKRLGNNESSEVENVIEANAVVQQRISSFWNVWSTDYLMELRDRQRKQKNRSTMPYANVGDIVLISDDNKKRVSWRTGRITDLIKGKDGIARGAVVVVVNNNGLGVLRRPINKLIPLECGNEQEEKVDLTEKEPSLSFISDSQTRVFGEC